MWVSNLNSRGSLNKTLAVIFFSLISLIDTCVNAFALQNRVLQKNQDLKNEKYHSMTQNFLSNDSF